MSVEETLVLSEPALQHPLPEAVSIVESVTEDQVGRSLEDQMV